MSKKTQVPGTKRFEFRPGVAQFPNFKGMDRQSDPGAVPTNKFWHLLNVRIRDGEILSRGGLEKAHTDGEDGCIVGLFDNLEPGAGTTAGMYITGHPDGITYRIGTYDGTSYSTFYESNADAVGGVFGIGTRLFTAVDTTMYEFVDGVRVDRFSTQDPIRGDMVELDGTFYILTSAEEVVTWDGVEGSPVVSDGTGLTDAQRLYVFNGEIYVACCTGGGVNPHILARAGGAYTNLGFIGGVTKAQPTSDGQDFNSKLYMGWAEVNGSERNLIITIDTSNVLALAHTASTHLSVVFAGVRAFQIFNGELVYLHNTTDTAFIGTYDGVTWTDDVKDFRDQADTGGNICVNMKVFDERLYVLEDLVLSPSPARDVNMLRSPDGAIAGTWEIGLIPAGQFVGEFDESSMLAVVQAS